MYQKNFGEIWTLVKYKMILRYIRENDEFDGMQRLRRTERCAAAGRARSAGGARSAECGRLHGANARSKTSGKRGVKMCMEHSFAIAPIYAPACNMHANMYIVTICDGVRQHGWVYGIAMLFAAGGFSVAMV